MTETELHPMAITDENSFQEAKGNGAGKNTQEEQKENSLNSINSNWEDPVIPSGMDTPDIPADLLPGRLGEYVDAVARNTQTPPGMAVMMSLSVVATCIQTVSYTHLTLPTNR